MEKMDKYDCNTDDFISAIEGEPVIWDSKLDEYSDKIAKRNAWERVIAKFVEGFQEKESAEKTKIGMYNVYIICEDLNSGINSINCSVTSILNSFSKWNKK